MSDAAALFIAMVVLYSMDHPVGGTALLIAWLLATATTPKGGK